MSITKHQLVAGFTITAQRERVSSISTPFYAGNEHASVQLHRLGTDAHAWLTPDEARELSRALAEAADVAESNTK